MIIPVPVKLVLLVVACVPILGCSALQEGFLDRSSELGPLTGVELGRATSADIGKRFGPPDEVDQRWFDSVKAEIHTFVELDTVNDENRYSPMQVLACEFVDGTLHGYVFQDFGGFEVERFSDRGLGKLMNGQSTKRDAETVLGAPDGRTLLPSSLTAGSPASGIGAIPAALGSVPEDAAEAWFYVTQVAEGEQRMPARKSLTLFFDAGGKYLKSQGLQQLVTRLP